MTELDLDRCINERCPWSGKPVSADSLTRYRGRVVGFSNPGCRDKFDQATRLFDESPARATTYRARRFFGLAEWRSGGQRLKVYGITQVGSPPPPQAQIDAARDHVERRLAPLSEAEGEASGVGYCMLHVGELGTWLLAHWWAHHDICCQTMAMAPAGTSRFEVVDDRPLHACVWEQVVIQHERDAWVRHGMASPPDLEAYLRDRLADGDY